MGARVAVVVPSLDRPHRIPQLITNLAATAGDDARLHLVLEGDDGASQMVSGECMIDATVGEFGTYAKALNAGYEDCEEPFVLTCDDDCVFHAAWLDAALRTMGGDVRVVGTNDLYNPYVLEGLHSTHSLLDRRYIDDQGGVIGQPAGRVLFEYDHNYTDVEFVETARARGVFAPCLDAVVEHIHPDFHLREPDGTSLKTRRAIREDWETFIGRRGLWVEALDVVLEYEPDWGWQ